MVSLTFVGINFRRLSGSFIEILLNEHRGSNRSLMNIVDHLNNEIHENWYSVNIGVTTVLNEKKQKQF